MCGFQAMVDLLNLQRDCSIFCQAPPLLPWDRPDGFHLQSRIDMLAKKSRRTFFGDAGSSYLPHLKEVLSAAPQAKIVCLQRPLDEVVPKFKTHLSRDYPCKVNHWSFSLEGNATWDPYWSRCYPKYDLPEVDDCLLRYCQQYYQLAEAFQKNHPANVKMIDPANCLDTYSGLQALFDFLEIPEVNRQYATGRWSARPVDSPVNANRSMAPHYSDDPLDPRRCVVLTPYHNSIHPHCDRGLDDLEYRGYTVRRIPGFTSIDQARNQLATDALLDGFQETMWIDSDVGFEADDVDRLRSHQHPVSSGIYAQKGKKSVASYLMPGMESITFGTNGGIIEILYAATGFLHVRRNVYLEVIRQQQLPICNEALSKPMIPFFEPMLHQIDDGTWYLVEDYAFSQRIRSAGFPIWADTSIRLWHFGSYGYGWEDTARQTERFDAFTINFSQKPQP